MRLVTVKMVINKLADVNRTSLLERVHAVQNTFFKLLNSPQKKACKRPSFSWLLPSLLLLFTLLPAALVAQSIPDQPTGHVNDYANMLSQGERQQLEAKLRNYRDTTTTVIAIATVVNLNGNDIQQVGTELFNRWNIWEGDQDNGVLLLISRDDRRIRIEVGYGLEGAIPDVMAGRIIQNIINPAFKRGNFYQGIDEATTALIQLASGEFKGTPERLDNNDTSDTASFIILLLFVAFVVFSISRKGGDGRNGGRRTIGPGGFIFLGGGLGGGSGGSFGGGGGFGGFGGGGFGSGGGGASGGW